MLTLALQSSTVFIGGNWFGALVMKPSDEMMPVMAVVKVFAKNFWSLEVLLNTDLSSKSPSVSQL